MPYVDSSQLPDLPLAFMNRDHAEEFRLLEELGQALEAHGQGSGTTDEILQRLAVLAVKTREHFLHEESVMREAAFPAYLPHKMEHDRVLAEMDAEAKAFRERGDTKRLRRYLIDSVPRWFVAHTTSMDVVTAGFVAARRTPR
ncbi:bacteriohemerythrin [Anaeromyxobacter sp. Fw109-5]|uniref:bacteriohemerythrin n=1 Tax=Anaeromyxobacter sp. (strain Fw109-5) TaxID=404589 RepID=UPI0000ED89FF|nr:hemerythrin family protein [Anaeromyxobacter sp. Fw109-5]ABS27249.1 hemerythrin-like metal-binding protein [Anaeromyxobacter sp. Fw109-5]